MCDVILQPAPGALQAPGTARLFLRFNSTGPPTFYIHSLLDLFFSHLHYFHRGASDLPGRRKKDFSGNRDAGSAVFIYGYSVRIALFIITPRIPFISFSPSLSLSTPTPSLSSPLSRRLACVVALRFDGKNPEERREPEDGEYEQADRSVTHFFLNLHPPNHLVAPDFYCREMGSIDSLEGCRIY